jgi:DNA-directed RNA polymerase specialized sigma24 family protein
MDMDKSAQRWMFKYAHKNYWRVASWYELDDLVQEGYMCWWRVIRHYPDATDVPHVMRLFQRTFSNRIHDLSKKRTAQLDLPIADCVSSEEAEATFIERNDVSVSDLHGLAHAATTVRNAICALVEQADKLRAPTRRYSDGKRQTTNEKLCSLTGCDPSMIDLVAEIKHCLGE